MLIISIGSFLLGNYKQALDLLATAPALEQAMKDLRVSDHHIFEKWLAEEQEYLKGLSAEPVIETLEMEYYQ